MSFYCTIRKKGLITLFPFLLILSACCYKNDSIWQIRSNNAACPGHRATKLSNVLCNNFREIKFEVVRTECDWRGYLVVHCVPLVPTPSEDASIILDACIDGEELEIECLVFEGGQRVLLPDDVTMRFIEALASGKTVQLRLGRYQSNLSPQGFMEAYSKF